MPKLLKDCNPFFSLFQKIFHILSVLVFILGCSLLGVSLWSLIKKLPYYILLQIKFDITYFTFPAAALCIPIFSIFLSARWSEVRVYLIHTLLVLQVISISMLIAAPMVGFMYYSENGNSSRMMSSLDNKDLFSSLNLSLSKYNSSKTIQFAWNRLQNQLSCCGIRNSNDWTSFGYSIPSSCCLGESKCYANLTFPEGCLECLSRDLVWQKNILVSHCYMGVTLHTVEAVIAGFTYLSAKQFDE